MSTAIDIPSLLRGHGFRLTPQRLTVAELVLSKPAHVTARKVYQTLKEDHPALSLNTVYLTLGQFEKSGLLNRFEINGNAVFDSNTMPHNHACCSCCGVIIDLPVHQMEQQAPSLLNQWQIQTEHRIWVGLCPNCMDEDRAGKMNKSGVGSI